jgi:hypothetical protein
MENSVRPSIQFLGTKRLLQILSNNSWILRDDSTGLDVMGAGGWWHHAEAVSSCLIHWSAPPSRGFPLHVEVWKEFASPWLLHINSRALP